ncbi:UDP-glucuronosyltransferase 1A9-like [Oppia nitens]|uniref:UDP-glucuronosyltransferase 1A9-like n=1 Tax=Oppia nitens TaxID=1686743 RepID=UPI0023D997B7|nr:UDP-glucuronosyltransferase 1A9-like [Oppia nitens]
MGHVNAAIGMAQVLIKAGHECWFAISDQWTDTMGQYGIQICPLSMGNNGNNHYKQVGTMKTIYEDALSKLQLGIIGDKLTPFQKQVIYVKNAFKKLLNDGNVLDMNVNRAICIVDPDVILCDQLISIPAIVKSGIPWVRVCSCNPLILLNDDCLPPHCLGLPIDGHKKKWLQIKIDFIQNVITNLQPGTELQLYSNLIEKSKYLNIYDFPLELDYNDIKPLPDNWYRFDNFMRQDLSEPFELPIQLSGKQGKVIYFSMGSVGAVDVNNMKRLIAILEKSQNVFIVSKGPLGDEYDLSDNMWGQPSVPQTQVLPLVDLVITHGGNNTITECFYFGKPMIVMPLFGDQFDNAQRVHEKGFGIRLDAYKCSEEKLLKVIESLLNDNLLAKKMRKISQRIIKENSLKMLPKILENLVNK